MIGGSHTGQTAYMIGPTQPEAMQAMFVRESASDLHDHWVYRGGAFEHGFITAWTALSFGSDIIHRAFDGAEEEQALSVLQTGIDQQDSFYWHLPISEYPIYQIAEGFQFFYDWVENQEDGPYWQQQNISLRHHQFDVPVYHLGGWYDIFLDGTIDNYVGMREHAASAEARQNQRMVIGPWIHGPTNVGVERVGALTFPGADEVQYNEIRLRWFDQWLRDIDTGILDEPPVLIYVMGDNEWRHEDEWPLARTEYTSYYFHDGESGVIDSLNDGVLSTEAPSGAQAADTFIYDPRDPIPTLGGNTLFIASGPQDHQEADRRSLTYTSEPLSEDLEVTGPISAVLYGLSSAEDTDWTVRLSEVYPDGRSINIADGVLRARYRNSTSSPELIYPDSIYEYEVDLWATSNVFQEGNRLRVSIHSSNFPRWSRNLNTAVAPEEGAAPEVAYNTVFHDALRPSHIILPVIPR